MEPRRATHISFNVSNLRSGRLSREQGSSASAARTIARGHSFFFVKDFDGNLIELMDLGYMYHVLNGSARWADGLQARLYKKY